MTCEHCLGADSLFNLKTAKKQKKAFLKKGLSRVSQKLFEEVKPHIEEDSTMLDIGGGIGGLQWEFYKLGGKSSTQVDSSNAYLEVAKDLDYELGFENKSQRLFGDFTDVAPEVSKHSILVMDKVLCCYPNFDSLLQASLLRCEKVAAFSFPMGGSIARLFRAFGVLYMKAIGNSFRPYVHDPQLVHEYIESQGFQRSSKNRAFPWNVWLYVRKDQS